MALLGRLGRRLTFGRSAGWPRLARTFTVQTVEFVSGILQRRFDCDGTTYGLAGAAPADFDDLDAFVVVFVEALGCDG